jgi:uncharacterized repeat protein (TIGR02543 family)
MRLSKIFIPAAAILVLLVAGIFSGCVPPVPDVIEVIGVNITEDDQSMKVDETLQLTAVVTPEDADNKAITWESDNPDVVTVSEDGLVTALSAGVANITVTTDDGAFTDSIKITVTSQPSGGGSSPAPEKYEVTFGAVELIEDIPNSINSRTILRGETSPNFEPNLAGVEIEIFSDMENTNSVVVITTDDEGMATVNLPAGTYYYNASKDGYADFPGMPDDTTNIWQYFLREILEVPETGISFTVPLEDSSEVMPCMMLKVWPVTFTAVDEVYFGITGISRNMTSRFQVPTLEEVSIEIYPEYIAALEFIFGSEETKEIAEKAAPGPRNPLMTTLTTDNSGTTQINLPSGDYIYTASKDGYGFIPNGVLGVTRSEVPKVPIIIYDLFFVTGEPTNVLFGMEKFWTVTFMDGETEYASQRVRDGDTAIEPMPDPTKEGYTFDGWYDENLTTEFNFEQPITEDTTLYAKWTESST